MHSLSTLFAALIAAGACATASAAPITLTFEGVGDRASVLEFYNGGSDSAGHAGSNYGISFSRASLGIIDADAGGTGNIGNEPSPSTVLFFLSGSAATMNVAAGFDTGFSFYYTSARAGFIRVYEGLNGTGKLLASLALNANTGNCAGDPNGGFCQFDPVGVAFAGIARSVDFGGSADYIAFDNVTLGASTPAQDVPEPGTLALVGLGLGGLARLRRRQS
ncbi:PEP-CTERM sorting domain-containing protein [Pseudoduganella sp. DS3]|uniref:PEP-CTERM sorting domain-containing protein n=1 Tax=Pseudoduganella guangdongensis TaxID=2692179 RepID=A0A6N9HH09_9BURK|nr:PEP-CTERM sorting domain-containing protein [Pseudoduganella guangdongensis]MYN02646.1 PEP-CTERM sorting domain-containing protein [Pseudoduganella guangdongensis]